MKDQQNSKCFVYFCILLVALSLSLTVFASVLKPKNPTLTINNLVIKSLEYDDSRPWFNITTHMTISLKNRNFGHLEFDHTIKNNKTMMSLSYGNDIVVGSSELKFRTSRVASRGEEEVEVEMMMSSLKSRLTVGDNDKIKSDLKLGFLEFKGYGMLKGTVHLLKKFRFHVVASMNCDIIVDLERQFVQRLIC